MNIKKLNEELKKLINDPYETYLSVEPIEGGFIPNTDIEYNAEIVFYDEGRIVDSIMIPLYYDEIKGDHDT